MSESWFAGGGEGGGEAGMMAVEKWEGSGEVVSRSMVVVVGLLRADKWLKGREMRALLVEICGKNLMLEGNLPFLGRPGQVPAPGLDIDFVELLSYLSLPMMYT